MFGTLLNLAREWLSQLCGPGPSDDQLQVIVMSDRIGKYRC
jgi:hypothetical protein